MHRSTPNGPNRDAGGRLYEDMPAITDRGWAGDARRDDSFGPPGLGGPLEAGSDRRQDEARALAESSQRALHGSRTRGPKNAARSDALITEELNERFTHDELLDATEILLQVDNGRVVLTGEVPERWMKHRAEDIAEGVRGVVDIENRIRVDNGIASIGPGGAVRSGNDTWGSGFSSEPANSRGQPRDPRVG